MRIYQLQQADPTIIEFYMAIWEINLMLKTTIPKYHRHNLIYNALDRFLPIQENEPVATSVKRRAK